MSGQIIALGQTIMKFDTPQYVLDEVNGVYDHRKENELARLRMNTPCITMN